MSQDTLRTMTKDYLELGFPVANFAWQGGEPTLMGLEFFQRAVELQKEFQTERQTVANSLQTNGILLDDDWCRFLHQENFLVGVSLDGPAVFHDHYRLDGAGRPTHAKVMAALDRCREHQVEFNILVLVNNLNVKEPDAVLDFLLEQDFKFLQFIPCVERDPETGKPAPFAVKPAELGDFLCRIFDRWVPIGPRQLSIRLFDSVLSYYLNQGHTNCTFNERCNAYIVVEHNGGVYCCDFFVTPEWHLGNLNETNIGELFNSPVKRRFAKIKRQVSNKCFVCRHFDTCRGGCMKDRIAITDSYNDPSYLCRAYQQFFDHALPTLQQIAGDIAGGGAGVAAEESEPQTS